MPISLSAKKSLRKSIKNRKVNSKFRDKVKSTIKKYLLKPNEAGLKEVFSMLDKAKKNYVYHQNKVSRLKSRMSKRLVKKDIVSEKKIVKPAAARALAGKKVK
jgi:ribosomal protein S20